MAVEHLTEKFDGVEFFKKPVPRLGMMQLAPGQGSDGYGKKISTDYMAKVNGRNHRVYCICFSNSGSLYVVVGGKNYYVRDFDVPDEVRQS